MNERSERIVAGLSGIAFVVLSAVVAALPPFPAVGASAQAVVVYYGAHQRAFLVLNFLGVAGLVPGLVVLAYLTAVFRRAEREGGWLWILNLAGGLFAFIAAWVDLALFQCAAYAAVRGDERIARALSDVATLTFGIFGELDAAPDPCEQLHADICRLSGDEETCSTRAARPMCSCSAMATK